MSHSRSPQEYSVEKSARILAQSARTKEGMGAGGAGDERGRVLEKKRSKA